MSQVFRFLLLHMADLHLCNCASQISKINSRKKKKRCSGATVLRYAMTASLMDAASSPGCSIISDPTPSVCTTVNSRKNPESLGPCTHLRDPDGVPESCFSLIQP